MRFFSRFRGQRAEHRQQVIDQAGAALVGFFGGAGDRTYGLNAVELLPTLQSPAAQEALRRQARWMLRSCPYLARFSEISMRRVLPQMAPLGVPDAVAEWWTRTWAGPVGIGGESGEQLERRAWGAFLADGEVFVTRTADGEIELIAADAVETVSTSGDEWLPVVAAWKVRGRTVAADRVLHVANRVDVENVRGRPLVATALPASRSRLTICANAGLGASIMARFAGLLKAGQSGIVSGAPGLGESGLDGTAPAGTTETAVKQFPAGSVAEFAAGMELHPPAYGMPADARAQVSALVDEIAAGLCVSRALLDGDISRANFASLRAGYAADQATFDAWCRMWVCGFRRPIWGWLVSDAMAAGEVPATAMQAVPDWKPPPGGEPNVEQEAKALAQLAELGLIDLDDEGTRRGVKRPSLQLVSGNAPNE